MGNISSNNNQNNNNHQPRNNYGFWSTRTIIQPTYCIEITKNGTVYDFNMDDTIMVNDYSPVKIDHTNTRNYRNYCIRRTAVARAIYNRVVVLNKEKDSRIVQEKIAKHVTRLIAMEEETYKYFGRSRGAHNNPK